MIDHDYQVLTRWSHSDGTRDYRTYPRQHVIVSPTAGEMPASADPHFRGDSAYWNPEELLLAALSQCHMLSVLAQAARTGIVITSYEDRATGRMSLSPDGGGQFTQVSLRPRMELLADEEGNAIEEERILALHEAAHAVCFIARSVNFPVRVEPVLSVAHVHEPRE